MPLRAPRGDEKGHARGARRLFQARYSPALGIGAPGVIRLSLMFTGVMLMRKGFVCGIPVVVSARFDCALAAAQVVRVDSPADDPFRVNANDRASHSGG